MINIIKNELIKFVYKKKFIVVIIAMFVITFGFMFFISSNSGKNGAAKTQNMLDRLTEQSNNLSEGSEKDKLNERIESLKNSLDEYEKLSDDSFDWKSYLESKNENLEELKKTVDDDKINTQIAMNMYLIENNIKPTTNYSMNSNLFFSNYLLILGKILLFLIIGIIVSDCITSEYNNDTIQAILTRPVSKFKIILGKIASNCIISVGGVLGFDLIAYVFSGIFFGFASLKTPLMLQPKFTHSTTLNTAYNLFIQPVSGTSTYISYGQLFLKSLFIQILFVICCVCFCSLISLLLKNSTTSITIAILFPILCFVMSVSKFAGGLKQFFYYVFSFLGDPISIIDGSLVTSSGAYFINFYSAVLILIVWIGILLSLMYVCRNKMKSN